MACFLVGGGEAIVVTAARSAVKKREIEKGIVDEKGNQLTDPAEKGICWTRKLGWLANMLWGGALLLLIEHIWHGEIVPWAPFFTAMATPDGTLSMLHEIATVGVAMAALVTVAWFGITLIADYVVKRAHERSVGGKA